MPTSLLVTSIGEGRTVLIETDLAIKVEHEPLSRGGARDAAASALVDALQTIREIATRCGSEFREFGADHPADVELTFGVKFGIEGGFVIAKTSADAQLEVKFKWNKSS